MEAFFRGQAAAQAEHEHKQALESSKLQQLVLKHHLDGLRIADQIRARELAENNLKLLHGQPAADIPSDTVTSQQPNLPSSAPAAGAMTGLPDVVSSLVRGRMGGDAAAPAPGPATLSAPAVQDAVPGTHPMDARVARPVNIPGVEGLGVPGVSVRPQSLEDIVRAAIRLKRAEQPAQIVGPEASLVGTNIDSGAPEVRYTNPTRRPNNTEFGQFQQIYAEGLGAPSFDALTPPQKAGAIPAYTKARQDPDVQAQLAEGRDLNVIYRNWMMAQGTSAAQDREAQREFTQQHQLYTNEITRATRQHTDAMKVWAAEQPFIYDGVNTLTKKPALAVPEYTPPSFEEWLASRGTAKPPKDTGVAAPGDIVLPRTAKTGTDTNNKQVTLAELQKIATRRGTTVDVERARAIAAGYAIVR